MTTITSSAVRSIFLLFIRLLDYSAYNSTLKTNLVNNLNRRVGRGPVVIYIDGKYLVVIENVSPYKYLNL